MKEIQSSLNKKPAKPVSDFMKRIYYRIILVFTLGLVMSFMVCQIFVLRSTTETYGRIIYFEKYNSLTSHESAVNVKNEISVTTDQNIGLIMQVGLSIVYTINIIPLIICFWFLDRVFDNIRNGWLFTEKNAQLFIFYGFIQMITVFVVPILAIIVSYITNMADNSKIYIDSRFGSIIDLIPYLTFIVVAYIIRYVVHLQDKSNQTL